MSSLTARNGRPGRRSPIRLEVRRYRQPDNYTCGPACLAQVYHYYGYPRPLSTVIRETPRNPDGGTVGVYMALAALEEGFRATIYTYNLHVFDPTWQRLARPALIRNLAQRRRVVREAKLRRVCAAYIDFLRRGGHVRFAELSTSLIVRYLAAGRPIITGLSGTWLYRKPREYRDRYNAIRGESSGHFVVICGYDPRTDRFVVTDPSRQVPFSRTGRYTVEAPRLFSAILLGDVTYDGVLLVLER